MTYKILIVEDDPVIRQQLQLLLAGSGYQVETAGDAAAALARMQTFVPHLVVLDIGLPGASGFELCSQIRAFSQAPIVFVTSSNTDQDELTSILLGGRRFHHQALSSGHPAGQNCRPAAPGLSRCRRGVPLLERRGAPPRKRQTGLPGPGRGADPQ